MPKSKRQRVSPTEQWHQLELWFTDPVQRIYELIRPVVLFRVSPAERRVLSGWQIGTAERILYRHVQRFTEGGIAKLFTPPVTPPPCLPPAMRDLIVQVKAEYPPLHLREIATICYIRFGRCPSRQAGYLLGAGRASESTTDGRPAPVSAIPRDGSCRAPGGDHACTPRDGMPNPSPPTSRPAVKRSIPPSSAGSRKAFAGCPRSRVRRSNPHAKSRSLL